MPLIDNLIAHDARVTEFEKFKTGTGRGRRFKSVEGTSIHATIQPVLTASGYAASGGSDTVEGWFARHGNVDKVGDRSVYGSFQETLADYAARGERVKVFYAHQW